MSAEPLPGPDDPGNATVIQFRTKSPSPRPTPRREDPVHDAGDLTPYQQLANTAEQLFLKHDRRTLTDDDTAAAYLITLHLVDDLIKGAHATGVIDDTQYQNLHDMIEGLKAAPGLA